MKFILKAAKIILKIFLALWELFFILGTVLGSTKDDYVFGITFVIIGIILYSSINALLNLALNKIQESAIKRTEVEPEERKEKNPQNDTQINLPETKDVAISDMYQFVQIPFEWQWVMQLQGNPGNRWFMLNMNNQYIALHYIQDIINLIEESKNDIIEISGFDFCTEDIDFGYPEPMYMGCRPCTFVLCAPYTKKGKISKYPVTLHFETSEYSKNKYGLPPVQIHPVLGEIHILKDGNIGSGFVIFITGDTKIEFGLYGISLVIKKVIQLSTNTTIYKYVLDKE